MYYGPLYINSKRGTKRKQIHHEVTRFFSTLITGCYWNNQDHIPGSKKKKKEKKKSILTCSLCGRILLMLHYEKKGEKYSFNKAYCNISCADYSDAKVVQGKMFRTHNLLASSHIPEYPLPHFWSLPAWRKTSQIRLASQTTFTFDVEIFVPWKK